MIANASHGAIGTRFAPESPDPSRPVPTHKTPGSSFSSIVTAVEGDKRMAAGAARFGGCECLPCPGRGNDGHGMTHCAECCFGSGVEADIDCPTHGAEAYNRGGL